MMGRNTRTVGTWMSLIVREDMSNDTAYELTRALCEGREDVITACPQWATSRRNRMGTACRIPCTPARKGITGKRDT